MAGGALLYTAHRTRRHLAITAETFQRDAHQMNFTSPAALVCMSELLENGFTNSNIVRAIIVQEHDILNY